MSAPLPTSADEIRVIAADLREVKEMLARIEARQVCQRIERLASLMGATFRPGLTGNWPEGE